MNSNLILKTKSVIDRYEMLQEGDTVVVGFSGGADSMTLLHALNELRNDYKINLIAAHVNHGIRGDEAQRDQDFCQSVCDAMGVKLEVLNADVPKIASDRGVSEEVAGRDVRYDFFLSLSGEHGKIATAHNANDAVETMVLNLCRGTGLLGLSSIPPKRANIIRPLIECSRQEIEQYIDDNNLSYVTDSTNLTDDYTRNRVRHNILPEFEKVNDNAMLNITRCISTLRDDSAYFNKQVDLLLDNASINDKLKTDVLLSADLAILSRALVTYVTEKSGGRPEKVHIDKIIDMMKVGRRDQVQIPGGSYVHVEKGKLWVINTLEDADNAKF